MRFVMQEASSEREAQECRALAARAHGFGPAEEPPGGWPERWLMGIAEGRLVATVGLAGQEACVRWFCGPSASALGDALHDAGARSLAELRLLSVEPNVRGFRFAQLLLARACSRAFLGAAGAPPALLLHAPSKTFRVLERVLGIRSRPVPGAGLRSACGPAWKELRLVLPEDDVPAELLAQPVPTVLEGAAARGRGGRVAMGRTVATASRHATIGRAPA